MATIDERLDRLTERHGALAQTLELTHASIQDLRATVEAHERYIKTLSDVAKQVLDVATNHERGLTRLESQ